MGRLLSRIKDMYWLDGGHGGQKNTWITSRSLLETLTRMGKLSFPLKIKSKLLTE